MTTKPGTTSSPNETRDWSLDIWMLQANENFVEALWLKRVEFLVHGGAAVRHYGCRDSTDVRDLDLLVNPSKENARRILETFSMLILNHRCIEQDFTTRENRIPVLGHYCIDLFTPKADIEFSALYERGVPGRIKGRDCRVISKSDLTEMKRSAVKWYEEKLERHRRDLQCLEGDGG